jgi:hypothetical protein
MVQLKKSHGGSEAKIAISARLARRLQAIGKYDE